MATVVGLAEGDGGVAERLGVEEVEELVVGAGCAP